MFPEESGMPVLMTAANVQDFSLQRALLDLHSSLYGPQVDSSLPVLTEQDLPKRPSAYSQMTKTAPPGSLELSASSWAPKLKG